VSAYGVMSGSEDLVSSDPTEPTGEDASVSATPEPAAKPAAPKPRPPIPKPGPPRSAGGGPVPQPAAAPVVPERPPASDGSLWGRVADDGTVYVRTADGERSVGQYPEGSADEALRFFSERFDALAFEVQLLETRTHTGAAAPDEAAESVRRLTEQVTGANAVGDLAWLVARLEALPPVIAEQREQRKAEKAQKLAEAKAAKQALAEEAEAIAAGTDWRNGANKLRALLDKWKALPRLDRASDDELWKRFSAARTTYTRHRKTHYAQENEKREGAAQTKQRLVKEAESLATSTDWGPTSGKYRDMMRDWKAAGPAPKEIENELWQRFRAAQDTFFGARDAANTAMDAEFAANAEVKEGLLAQAEALIPQLDAGDLDGAKKAFRDIADKWDAAGKVPRERIKDLEGRMRTIEQRIRSLEDNRWKASDPEKSARADDMVGKLEAAIAKAEADLEAAQAAGNAKRVTEIEADLTSRRAFLEMAKKASAEFS
jgi:hypothetical protein